MSSKKNSIKYKVNIVESAEKDLFEIYQYIFFNDCEENADKIYSKLIEKIKSLREFPNRGHVPTELKLLGVEDFLELNYRPYRIIYQIIGNEVFIHSILDGRRDMQKLLEEKLLRD